MKIPTPKQLAEAIAQTSLSVEEKQEIVNNLPYLNEFRIKKLYKTLQNYHEEEKKFIKSVERVDLKYKMKVEKEISKKLKSK